MNTRKPFHTHPVGGIEYWQLEVQPWVRKPFEALPERYESHRQAWAAAVVEVMTFPETPAKACRVVHVIETKYSHPDLDVLRRPKGQTFNVRKPKETT